MVFTASSSYKKTWLPFLLFTLTALSFLAFAPDAEAATKYWRGTGTSDRWEVNTNWSTLPRGPANTTVPVGGDTAIFNMSGTTVRFRSNVVVDGILMSNVWTGSLITGTGVLRIGTSGLRIGSGTFVGSNTGAINITGGLTMTGGIVRGIQGNSLGALNMSGSLAINSVSNSRPSFTLTGTLVMSGNATQTYNIGQNRVTAIIQNLTLNNSGGAGSNRLMVTGSGASFSGAVIVTQGILDLTKTSTAQPLVIKGGLTIQSSASFLSGNNVTLSGSLIARSNSTFTATGGTFTLNSDNPQTIALYGAKRFTGPLVVNNTGTAGTRNRVTMSGGGLYSSGSLTITAGMLDLMTNTQNLSVKGGLTLAASSAAKLKTNTTVSLSGSVTLGANSIFNQTGSTLTFYGDNPQTVTINSSNQRFNSIVINNTAGTVARNLVTFAGSAFTTSGSVTVTQGTWDANTNGIGSGVAGGITVADSALARFLTSANLSLSGTLVVKPAATFTQSAGTMRLSHATSQTLSGSMTFFVLQNAVTNGTALFYPGHTYVVSSSLLTQGVSSSSMFTMNSAIAGSTWSITPPSQTNIFFVKLKDSTNTRLGANVRCTDCTNQGNNLNWSFESSPTVASGGGTSGGGGSSGGGGGGGGGGTRISSAESSAGGTQVVASTSPSKKLTSRQAKKVKALERRMTTLQKRIALAKNASLKKALQKLSDRLQKAIDKIKK